MDGPPIQPIVLPKATRMAVAERPCGRGAEDRGGLGVEGDLKVAPGPGGVGALDPAPPCTQGNTKAAQIRYVEPAKGEGPADLLPVDQAVAGGSVATTVPKKAPDNPVDLPQNGRRESHGHEQVSRHGR